MEPQEPTAAGGAGGGRRWTVFSNHGHVLFYLAANPDATQRAVSDSLGLTERQVSRIVRDLEGAGMVRVERPPGGPRRNTYAVNHEARLRHPTLAHVPLGRIVDAVAGAAGERTGEAAAGGGSDSPRPGPATA